MMRNYTIPPSLPTYNILLEGENMSPAMGILRDDLMNVCMRHVEKICKGDLSRNFIERNHMENGKEVLSRWSGGLLIPRRISALEKGTVRPHVFCSWKF